MIVLYLKNAVKECILINSFTSLSGELANRSSSTVVLVTDRNGLVSLKGENSNMKNGLLKLQILSCLFICTSRRL